MIVNKKAIEDLKHEIQALEGLIEVRGIFKDFDLDKYEAIIKERKVILNHLEEAEKQKSL